MRTSRILVAAMIAALAACGPEEDELPDDGNLPGLGAAPRTGDVGQGYDSVGHTIKAMTCIQPPAGGKWRESGIPVSNISMTLQSDRTQVARSLGLDVEASYGIASAAASFLRETETDDLSVSYIFGGTMDFKGIDVGPAYEVVPQLAGKDIIEWRRLCGDSFIQSVQRGAALFTAMKFHFASRTDKQTFEAKFKVSGALKASAALKEAQKQSTQNVGVSISAVQVGGEVSQLPGAISGLGAKSCSMGEIADCLGYVDRLEGYAANTFPKQFRDGSGRPLEGEALDRVTATTGYNAMPWTDLVIPDLPDLSGKPEAIQLLQQFARQFSTQARIDAIRGIPTGGRRSREMADQQRLALDAASLKVARNIAALNQAWSTCWPEVTGTCAADIDAAIAGLETIDPEHLEPWFDMLYPDATKGNPLDLVDFRGDGHLDLCYNFGRGTVISCLLAVGEGFEEKPRRQIDHGQAPLANGPYAWVKLGGAKLDLAYCGPPQMTQPMLHCIPVVDGTLKGTVLFIWTKSNDKVDIRSSLDTTGIDGRAVFKKAASTINGRWNGVWPAGK